MCRTLRMVGRGSSEHRVHLHTLPLRIYKFEQHVHAPHRAGRLTCASGVARDLSMASSRHAQEISEATSQRLSANHHGGYTKYTKYMYAMAREGMRSPFAQLLGHMHQLQAIFQECPHYPH